MDKMLEGDEELGTICQVKESKFDEGMGAIMFSSNTLPKGLLGANERLD